MNQLIAGALCVFLVVDAVAEDKVTVFQPKDRVVFLGDSNTYSGVWIEWFDAWQRQAHPEWELDVINVGLSSETTSGLSEPSHPFPRPDVRERLGRVLDKTRPNVVFFCYGMNDAIYHPFNQERFETFQKGSLEAVRKIKATGTRLIWLTPPPFDPQPLQRKGKLRPAGASEYSWQFVADDYDQTIARYAAWILGQKNEADIIIDCHTPLASALTEMRRKDGDFAFTNDGVHFNTEGHVLVARSVLQALGATPKLEFDAPYMKLIRQRLNVMRDAYLSDIGHLRPGIAKGQPLAEALSESSKLNSDLRKMLKEKPSE